MTDNKTFGNRIEARQRIVTRHEGVYVRDQSDTFCAWCAKILLMHGTFRVLGGLSKRRKKWQQSSTK